MAGLPHLISKAAALAARTTVGGLAALPVAAASLVLLTWLRWHAIPLRTVAAEVLFSSGAMLVSLLPAAAAGAWGRGPLARRIARALLVAVVTIAPTISLAAGRRVAEVVAAATARPVDFCMLFASHASGCAVAAAVAGALSPRRSRR